MRSAATADERFCNLHFPAAPGHLHAVSRVSDRRAVATLKSATPVMETMKIVQSVRS